MSYNVANFDQTVHSEGVQGTVQVSDGSLGFEGANGVTINSLGDITANAFFGYTSGGGGGGGATPNLQAVTVVGASTNRAMTISNSLTVTGNLFVTGNLVSVDTENLVVQDPVIQLANNSTSDTTDTGILFTRPTSNIVVGWRGDEDEFMVGFSTSSASGTDLVPLDDNKLNLKVYGNVEATNFVKGDATHLTNTTGATTGTYGGSDFVSSYTPVITVDSSGRITSITEDTINFPTQSTPGLNAVVTAGSSTAQSITVGGITVTGTDALLGDANSLSNTVSNEITPGTYGSGTQVPQIVIDSDHRIASITTVPNSGGDVGSLQDVSDTGNTTSNTIQFTNTDVSLVASGNVEVQGLYIGNANLLSNIVNSDVGPATYGNTTHVTQITISDTGRISAVSNIEIQERSNLDQVVNRGNVTSNTVQFTNTDVSLVASGNVEVQGLYIGNANLLSNIVNSDVGPAIYGNTTHVTQITITDTGRISAVSNVEIQERSNLDQVVNRGNVTSNTVQFTNAHTALVTDLTSNVGIKIDQLSSVNITSLQAEQGLLYDGTDWVNDYSVRNFTKIKNKTGDTLYQGNTVYIVDGHNANVANVALADATDSSKMPAIGLVFADIADQGEGVAVTYGKVQNVNTDNFIEGETVYVSNTQVGGFSNVKPTINGDFIQNVGIVVKSDPSHGVVFVTGVGRTNDIPNGTVTTEQSDMLYMYGETAASRFAKITPDNFRSNLDQVVNRDNATSTTLELNAPRAIVVGGQSNIYFNGSINLHSGSQSAAIALGNSAGSGNTHTISMGYQAGGRRQRGNAIAIGNGAGFESQGENSIAIGNQAGRYLQPNRTIILSATGQYFSPLSPTDATFIKPIRVDQTSSNVLGYRSSAGEIVDRGVLHSNLDQVVNTGNVTTNVLQTGGLYSTGNVETSELFLGNANLLSNIVNSDVGPATYGNTTHVTQITISDTGRITAVSNIEIQELSNLDQVVNRGNVTSNSIQVSGIVATGQANVANIVVSQAVGAGPTVSSNIITVDQAGHSYKFFRVPAYPTGSLEGITIQNATDGCQTLVDIHPVGGDLDVFENFSNGGAGPTVLTSLNSNLVINTGNHIMISCVTDLSNTFVNIIGFY